MKRKCYKTESSLTDLVTKIKVQGRFLVQQNSRATFLSVVVYPQMRPLKTINQERSFITKLQFWQQKRI